MPRNACQECRARKIRCEVISNDDSCVRCKSRGYQCSYSLSISEGGTPRQPTEHRSSFVAINPYPPDISTPSAPGSAYPPDVPTSGPSSAPAYPPDIATVGTPSAEYPPKVSTPAQSINLHTRIVPKTPAPISQKRKATYPSYILRDELEFKRSRSGYDIGSGTPSDILREGELCKELVKLYFANFSDVHSLFDEDRFLREYDMGEIQPIVLYAMMALGIKYSKSSLFEETERSHRGESLFNEARKLLQENFDTLSLTTVQVYILLSTYHLTFGAARKAWHYLGSASNMAKLLRLTENPLEGDPIRVEWCRRVVCTIALVDRTLSPALTLPTNFPPRQRFYEPCTDQELKRMKLSGRHIMDVESQAPNLKAEIFRLSHIFQKVITYYRQGGQDNDLQGFEREQQEWINVLPESLKYTEDNFRVHQKKGTLRQFLYLHLLFHHIGQLLLFPALQTRNISTAGTISFSRTSLCHSHARSITEIVDFAWSKAGMDVHNVHTGQILTVAAAVHTHSCLTAGSKGQRETRQVNLTIISDYCSRVRKHCRSFDRVSAQLDAFYQICVRSSSSRNTFDREERLLRHVVRYGTAVDGLDNRKTGNIINLAESLEKAHAGIKEPSPMAAQEQDYPWHKPAAEESEDIFQNCAWLFSSTSLNDLLSMAYSAYETSILLDV